MLTEKDYCDYDTCVALEEVGMLLKTQIVRSYAKEGIQTSKIYPDRPSLYEAQKWLREEKALHVEISIFANNYDVEIIATNGDKHGYHNVFIEKCGFKSYEEALLEGVKCAVKILKEM